MKKNILKNILNKSKEDQSYISIYSNKDNTDLFSLGIVCDFDDEFLLSKKLSPEGNHDGFSCQLIEDIYSIEIGNSYINKITSFVKKEMIVSEQKMQRILMNNFRFDDAIKVLCKEDILVSINSVYDLSYVGYVTEFDGEHVLIKNIDEYNNEDGFSFFRISEIERISIDTIELNEITNLT